MYNGEMSVAACVNDTAILNIHVIVIPHREAAVAVVKVKTLVEVRTS
jgi:hypothetical protein